MAETIEIDINARDNTTGAANSARKNFQDLGRELGGIGSTMTRIFTQPIMDLTNLVMKNKEVQDSLKPLKEEWGKITEQLATSFIPVIKDLTPTLISLAQSISMVVGWFSGLTVGQKEAIISFVGIVAALGPVLIFVSQLITFVGSLSAAWGTLSAIIAPISGTVLPAIGAVLAGITLPVWGLIAAIGLLVAAIIIFGKDAWNTIQTIGKIFEALWLLIRIKVDQIKQAFFSVDWGGIGRNMMEGIVNGIRAGWNWVVNAARSVAQAAFDAARNALWSHSPSLKFEILGKNMMQGLANGVDMNAGKAISSTSKAVSATIPAAITSVGSNGGGGTPFVYAPMISLANEAEAERVLLPMLRKLQRAA